MPALVGYRRLTGGVPSWLLDPNVTLDMDFTTRRVWGASMNDLSVTSASGGYGQKVDGSWQLFAPNTLRCTDKGLLVEEARTNLFLNSLAPVTQTITVANATAYTVSLYASGGTLTLSGAGTGTVNANSSVTFTSSTTSLTVTVNSPTGTFQCVNVEAGSFKTSPIATTGAAATRAADVVRLPVAAALNVVKGVAGTMYAEVIAPVTHPAQGQVLFAADDGTGNNRQQMFLNAGGNVPQFRIVAGGVAANPSTVGSATPGAVHKQALAWAVGTNQGVGVVNGATPVVSSPAAVAGAAITQIGIGTSETSGGQLNSYIRRVALFSTNLANATLQSLTT